MNKDLLKDAKWRLKIFNNNQFVYFVCCAIIKNMEDTNKIQEKIIKNVAKNCNFVAVGDVKQGIYGFRLASSEIFLKDMEDFSKNDDKFKF